MTGDGRGWGVWDSSQYDQQFERESMNLNDFGTWLCIPAKFKPWHTRAFVTVQGCAQIGSDFIEANDFAEDVLCTIWNL